METNSLFRLGQELWLNATADPSLLFGMRMVGASLFGVLALLWVWNALSPNELEDTWEPEDCRRFRVVHWLMAIATTGVAVAYTLAGLFERDRTSSPGRLVFQEGTYALLGLALIMLTLAWRAHYYRKRLRRRSEGKDVVVK